MVQHIEMPFALYDRAVLDANCLCHSWASCTVFLFRTIWTWLKKGKPHCVRRDWMRSVNCWLCSLEDQYRFMLLSLSLSVTRYRIVLYVCHIIIIIIINIFKVA